MPVALNNLRQRARDNSLTGRALERFFHEVEQIDREALIQPIEAPLETSEAPEDAPETVLASLALGFFKNAVVDGGFIQTGLERARAAREQREAFEEDLAKQTIGAAADSVIGAMSSLEDFADLAERNLPPVGQRLFDALISPTPKAFGVGNQAASQSLDAFLNRVIEEPDNPALAAYRDIASFLLPFLGSVKVLRAAGMIRSAAGAGGIAAEGATNVFFADPDDPALLEHLDQLVPAVGEPLKAFIGGELDEDSLRDRFTRRGLKVFEGVIGSSLMEAVIGVGRLVRAGWQLRNTPFDEALGEGLEAGAREAAPPTPDLDTQAQQLADETGVTFSVARQALEMPEVTVTPDEVRIAPDQPGPTVTPTPTTQTGLGEPARVTSRPARRLQTGLGEPARVTERGQPPAQTITPTPTTEAGIGEGAQVRSRRPLPPGATMGRAGLQPPMDRAFRRVLEEDILSAAAQADTGFDRAAAARTIAREHGIPESQVRREMDELVQPVEDPLDQIEIAPPSAGRVDTGDVGARAPEDLGPAPIEADPSAVVAPGEAAPTTPAAAPAPAVERVPVMGDVARQIDRPERIIARVTSMQGALPEPRAGLILQEEDGSFRFIQADPSLASDAPRVDIDPASFDIAFRQDVGGKQLASSANEAGVRTIQKRLTKNALEEQANSILDAADDLPDDLLRDMEAETLDLGNLFRDESGAAQSRAMALIVKLGFGAVAGERTLPGETPEDRIANALIGMGVVTVGAKGIRAIARRLSRAADDIVSRVPGAAAPTEPPIVLPRRDQTSRALTAPTFEGRMREARELFDPQSRQLAQQLLETDLGEVTVEGVGRLNLARYNTPERVKQLIRSVENQRPTPKEAMSMAELRQHARRFGYTIEDVTSFSDDPIQFSRFASAVDDIHTAVARKTEELRRAVLNGNEQMSGPFLFMADLEAQLVRSAAEVATDLGRGLNALKHAGDGTIAVSVRDPEALLARVLNTDVTPQEFAFELASMREAQRALFMRQLPAPTVAGALRELYVNTLLGSLDTLGKNALSTLTAVGSFVPQRFFRSRVARFAGDEAVTGEASRAAWELVTSAWDAFRLMGRTAATGQATFAKTSRLEEFAPQITRRLAGKYADGPLGAFFEYAGEYVRLASRGLIAADDAAQMLLHRMESRAMVFRRVQQGVIDPADADELVERLLFDAEAAPDIFQQAVKTREEFTFTNSLFDEDRSFKALVNMARGVDEARRRSPVLQLFFPFVRTPTDLVTFAGDRTPGINLLSAKNRRVMFGRNADPAEKAEAWARMFTGMGALSLGAALGAAGLAFGFAPFGRAQRQTWFAAGGQENRIIIGDRAVPLDPTEPFGWIIGMGATLGLLANEDKKEFSPLYRDGMMSSLLIATELAGDDTFLRGFTILSEALHDGKLGRAILADHPDDTPLHEVLIDTLGRSFLPTGLPIPFPTRTTQDLRELLDPYRREHQGIMEAIMERSPVLSKSLPMQTNIFNEPVMYGYGYDGSILNNGLRVIVPHRDSVQMNAAGEILLENGIDIDQPSDTVQVQHGTTRLNPHEYAKFKDYADKPPGFKTTLAEWIIQASKLPAWQNASEAQRDVFVHNQVNRRRRLARELILRDPEFNILQRVQEDRVRQGLADEQDERTQQTIRPNTVLGVR